MSFSVVGVGTWSSLRKWGGLSRQGEGGLHLMLVKETSVVQPGIRM